MPSYTVDIEGKKYEVASDSPLTDLQAYTYAKQQHDQAPSALEESYSPAAMPGVIKSPTAKDAYGEWLAKKKQQLGVGAGVSSMSEKAQAVGGGLLDTLALTMRPSNAITAGLNAQRLGLGDFTTTATGHLLGGETKAFDPQTNKMKDLTDVTYGVTPKGTWGKAGKSLLNLGRDMIGISGGLNLFSKGVRMVPSVAKAMNAAPPILKGLSQVPNFIENTGPNMVMTPVLKTGIRVVGSGGKALYNLVPNALKLGLNSLARSTINMKAGVNKGVVAIGERGTRLQNELNAYTNDIYLKSKQAFSGKSGEDLAAAKARIGKVAVGKEAPQATTNLLDKALKRTGDTEALIRKEFAEKQMFKYQKMKEWRTRLRAIGVHNAFEDTFKNITHPEDFYHRVFELDPGNLSNLNREKIVQSINEAVAVAGARGKQKVVASLERLKQGYLTKSKDMIETELGALNFGDKTQKGWAHVEDTMNQGMQSAFKHRVLPEHLAQVFKPRTDIDTLMKTERSVDAAFAAMESRVGLLEKQYHGTLPKPASIEETDRLLKHADRAGIFKGIGDVIPDVRTDKITYDYIAQKLGEVNEIEKLFLHNPATQWITNTWKTFKLFNPAAITRNFIQGSSLASQHGINQLDYVPAVRTAYKMAAGKMHQVDRELRPFYSRLNGSGTSLAISDLLEPTAIKTFGAEKLLPVGLKKGVSRAWDVMGHSFRSTDDGLRIAMFNKKVQEFAGKPLKQAIKNDVAVQRAFKYVDENTIKYDDLPALARWMKLINPFFAFTFRAPRQYLKGMVESPALMARYKASGRNETERNLEGTPKSIRNLHEAQRNLLAEAMNTFGGNVVIDSKGKVTGVPSIEYIDMAPLSIAMRRPSAGIYNPTLKAQAIDVASQMTGLNLSGDAPPITPIGAAYSGAKIIPALGGEGEMAEKARRDLAQSLLPTALTHALSIIPPEIYDKLNAGKFAKAVYPVRGGTPQRNLLTALGIKTKVETYEDIVKNFTAGTTETIAGPISRVQAEANTLFPYDKEKRKHYIKSRIKHTVATGKTKLPRVLKALKGL